jgi:Na+(H+)/acetate symporter ActP
MSTKGDQFGGAAAFIVAAVIGGIALADNPDTGIDDWLIVGAIVIGLLYCPSFIFTIFTKRPNSAGATWNMCNPVWQRSTQ